MAKSKEHRYKIERLPEQLEFITGLAGQPSNICRLILALLELPGSAHLPPFSSTCEEISTFFLTSHSRVPDRSCRPFDKHLLSTTDVRMMRQALPLLAFGIYMELMTVDIMHEPLSLQHGRVFVDVCRGEDDSG